MRKKRKKIITTEKNEELICDYWNYSISKTAKANFFVFMVFFAINGIFFYINGFEAVGHQILLFVEIPILFVIFLSLLSIGTKKPGSPLLILRDWLILAIAASACFLIVIKIIEICGLLWIGMNR